MMDGWLNVELKAHVHVVDGAVDCTHVTQVVHREMGSWRVDGLRATVEAAHILDFSPRIIAHQIESKILLDTLSVRVAGAGRFLMWLHSISSLYKRILLFDYIQPAFMFQPLESALLWIFGVLRIIIYVMVIGNNTLRLSVGQLHVSRCLLIPGVPGALELVVEHLPGVLSHVHIGSHLLMLWLESDRASFDKRVSVLVCRHTVWQLYGHTVLHFIRMVIKQINLGHLQVFIWSLPYCRLIRMLRPRVCRTSLGQAHGHSFYVSLLELLLLDSILFLLLL